MLTGPRPRWKYRPEAHLHRLVPRWAVTGERANTEITEVGEGTENGQGFGCSMCPHHAL